MVTIMIAAFAAPFALAVCVVLGFAIGCYIDQRYDR